MVPTELEEKRRRANYRAKMRRRKRRKEDPEFRAAEARWARAYRDRARGGPPQKRKKKMDPFTKNEIEAATRVLELITRGGDASTILRGKAHRSFARKLFAMRDKARKRANSPKRVVG